MIRIGTSGWSYKDWRGRFYPADLPAERALAFMAERFDTVEINRTFYRLPSKRAVAEWRETVPEGFLFACKASRYTTHMKKLREPAKSARLFFEAVDELGPRLGPILFQLPPGWRKNADRLKAFLAALPAGHRYAFEFRNRSWWCDEVYHLLAAQDAAFCIYDLGGETSPKEVTAGFVYVRLHGPAAARYSGSYSGQALAAWGRRFAGWEREGRDIYCYFDNDVGAAAPHDAARLRDLMSRRAQRPAAAVVGL